MNTEIKLSKNQTTFDKISVGDVFVQEAYGEFYQFIKVNPSITQMDGNRFNAIYLECGELVLFKDTEEVIIPSSVSLAINI